MDGLYVTYVYSSDLTIAVNVNKPPADRSCIVYLTFDSSSLKTTLVE